MSCHYYYRILYCFRGILMCIIAPLLCTCTFVSYIFVYTYMGRSLTTQIEKLCTVSQNEILVCGTLSTSRNLSLQIINWFLLYRVERRPSLVQYSNDCPIVRKPIKNKRTNTNPNIQLIIINT